MSGAARAQADIAELIWGKVILVTGKGGVGKTSVAASLGRLAAAQGRKTLVLELDAQNPSLNAVFAAKARYEPIEVQPNLFIANLDWLNALKEWVERVIPAKRIVERILENHIVQLFLDATPGNREVVTLSKLVWLSGEFDLVVVDLPASGHATAMLRTPQEVMNLFTAGPLHQRHRTVVRLRVDLHAIGLQCRQQRIQPCPPALHPHPAHRHGVALERRRLRWRRHRVQARHLRPRCQHRLHRRLLDRGEIQPQLAGFDAAGKRGECADDRRGVADRGAEHHHCLLYTSPSPRD